MSNLEEIREAYNILSEGTKNIALLHCISAYPTNENDAKLANIYKLKDQFDCIIGHSDHTNDIFVPFCAISAGAQVIEKHFTIDNDLPGRDNKFAILPNELANLSSYLKLRDEMLIDHGVDFQDCEIDSRNNYTGRFDG